MSKMWSLRYRWPMFPQTINAMYQFYENEIGKVNWTVVMKCSNLVATLVTPLRKMVNELRKRVK